MENKTNIHSNTEDNVAIQVTNGVLVLESHFLNATPYKIFTVYGEEVTSGIVEYGYNSIALGNLCSGIYLFKMLDFNYNLIID